MSDFVKFQIGDENSPFTIETKHGTLDPTTIWEEKDRWIERESKSLEAWKEMDEDTKSVLIDIIDKSLQRMRDRLDVWVPASLGTESAPMEQGDYIDIQFRLIFSDVDREKQAKLELTERRLNEAKEEARRLAEELEAS